MHGTSISRCIIRRALKAEKNHFVAATLSLPLTSGSALQCLVFLLWFLLAAGEGLEGSLSSPRCEVH